MFVGGILRQLYLFKQISLESARLPMEIQAGLQDLNILPDEMFVGFVEINQPLVDLLVSNGDKLLQAKHLYVNRESQKVKSVSKVEDNVALQKYFNAAFFITTLGSYFIHNN